MQRPLVGDITVRVEKKIRKGNKTKTQWQYKPVEQLNECFRAIEVTGELATHIKMNSKTLAEIEKIDKDRMVVTPSTVHKSGKAVWYAELEVDDRIPDNKFVLLVKYPLRDCKDCSTCKYWDDCDFPNKGKRPEAVEKPAEEEDEPGQ